MSRELTEKQRAYLDELLADPIRYFWETVGRCHKFDAVELLQEFEVFRTKYDSNPALYQYGTKQRFINFVILDPEGVPLTG